MSNLTDHAIFELDNAFPGEQDEMQKLIMSDIMELIETFSKQNHSRMSGCYCLRYFNRLVHYLPIKPLTGEDDEWGEPFSEENIQQNKRCSQIFRKNFDNKTAQNIEGKTFISKRTGLSYTNGDSSISVTFPYEVPDEPEKVYVD